MNINRARAVNKNCVTDIQRDIQTDRQTDRQTDGVQNKYSPPEARWRITII